MTDLSKKNLQRVFVVEKSQYSYGSVQDILLFDSGMTCTTSYSDLD